jgi:hypothetical protein
MVKELRLCAVMISVQGRGMVQCTVRMEKPSAPPVRVKWRSATILMIKTIIPFNRTEAG